MLNNFWKISVVVLSALQFTHAWQLVCFCGSYDNQIIIPDDNVQLFTDNEGCFKLDLRTLMYTFGYMGSIEKNGTISFVKAYTALHDRNICVVDWTEEASQGIPLANFSAVSLKALAIGREFGNLLIKIINAGLKLSSLHLVGHSLGAHMLGQTGRKLIENGMIIPRITGLDPAKPQFDGPKALPLFPRLEKSCAAFVDIIHTNPKLYGMETPTGTIDFYPNYGKNVQPGCKEGIFLPLSPEGLCSHDRSRDLMIQSLSTPYDLQASNAPNYPTWVKNDGAPIRVTTIGDFINTTYSGLYYLTTNGQPPYGKKEEGLKPDPSPTTTQTKAPLIS